MRDKYDLDQLQPFVGMLIAGAIGTGLVLYTTGLVLYTTCHRPTFEQRWAPVKSLDTGIRKGDRLDRPRYNYNANPYLGYRLA